MAEVKRKGPMRIALWVAVVVAGVLIGLGPQNGTRAIAQSEQAGPHTSIASNGARATAEAFSSYADSEDPFEGSGDAELDPELAPVTESAGRA
jgi:hypothetical protein